MPTNNTRSPFVTTFVNAVKRGVPCNVAVQNIANRTGKTTKSVFNTLCKAGVCYRQKVNGGFVYFPMTPVKVNSTSAKNCQINMWQQFCDWCICSGVCTPNQLRTCCGSQTTFMNNCKRFFNAQITGFTPVKMTANTFMTGITGGRTTSNARRGTAKWNTRKTTTRRYRSAA
jgi:hypothetical protein